ncbi:hypothetical protein SAMN05443247_11574 [Bradyrhizobium erythrophlei]|nr:hypothetical protein SAMN05443247_11574 [Bradyrhizobium erythrophlei]
MAQLPQAEKSRWGRLRLNAARNPQGKLATSETARPIVARADLEKTIVSLDDFRWANTLNSAFGTMSTVRLVSHRNSLT